MEKKKKKRKKERKKGKCVKYDRLPECVLLRKKLEPRIDKGDGVYQRLKRKHWFPGRLVQLE